MADRSIFYRVSDDGTGQAGPVLEALGTTDEILISGLPNGTPFQINIGDGVWLDLETLSISVSPTATSSPVIIPATGDIGTVFTVSPGTYSGSAPMMISGTLTQAGSDVTDQMEGDTFTSTASGQLTWTETATNNAGTAGGSVSATITVAMAEPAIETSPTISGGPVEGSTLTSTTGTASGSPAPTPARQWLSNGVAVSGSTGATFDTTGRAGQAISLHVAWTNGVGSPASGESEPIVVEAIAVAPTRTEQASISPATGPVGTVYTITPASFTGTAPIARSGTLTQAGVTVATRADGNTFTFTSTASGALEWTGMASNGTTPNGTESASATIEAAAAPDPNQRNWTLDDIPTAMRTNGGLWDFANAQVIDGKIASVPNPWGGASMSQSTVANRPVATMVDGRQAGAWPLTDNGVGLNASAAYSPAWYIAVTQYGDGVTAEFVNSPSVIADPSANAGRIYGSSLTANLAASDAMVGTTPRRNGGAASLAVLPLPTLSTLQTEIVPSSYAWGIGRTNFGRADRGWKGNVWLAIALGTVPDTALRQQIEGYLHWEFGTQYYLPADHPYKAARPVVTTTAPEPEPEPDPAPSEMTITMHESGFTAEAE